MSYYTEETQRVIDALGAVSLLSIVLLMYVAYLLGGQSAEQVVVYFLTIITLIKVNELIS